MCFGKAVVHFFPNFSLYRPPQRSARSQVPSQVATHQEDGSQLWAGETPDLNSGLLDNSLVRYHWATMPPSIEPPSLPNNINIKSKNIFWTYLFSCPQIFCDER